MNGVELKKLREERGISQQTLSDLTGIPQGTIGRYESSGKDIAKATTVKILERFFSKGADKQGTLNVVADKETGPYTPSRTKGIPMIEAKAAAGGVVMYQDVNAPIIGYLNIPGFEDCDFALPVWGHSMYPTFENGAWIICKGITNARSIAYGECYYIEWEDYRMVKRLIAGDDDDTVILYSDNETEKIGGRVKYGPIKIKKEEIRKLFLIKGCHKKLNH